MNKVYFTLVVDINFTPVAFYTMYGTLVGDKIIKVIQLSTGVDFTVNFAPMTLVNDTILKMDTVAPVSFYLVSVERTV